MPRNYRHIEHSDRELGQLLQQLEEDGLTENTYVFHWSDHGPLTVRCPDIAPGRVKQDLVSTVDLGPTVPQFWGTAQIGGMDNNNPEAAARVINYLVSDQGYELTALGIEGRNWEKVDGEVQLLAQRAKDGFSAHGAGQHANGHPLSACIVSWVPQEWRDWMLLYGKDQAFKDWFYQHREKNQDMYQTEAYGSYLASPLWNDFQPTSNDLVNIAFLEIVTADSEEAPTARFDQFVEDWLAAGGAEAQAEMSQLVSETYE